MRTALALLLAVLALPAFALGLGQIRVKSKPGQPLLAEIPVVTSDPTELQGLQARLASPDTFRRVGLEPPQGNVSGLRFEPALDQDGKPVIRVTSAEPVQQAELTFLVEVDWGEGRLVREYSALVDPPRSLAAAAAPQVEAPQAASAPTIQRPAAAEQPQRAEAQDAPAAATASTETTAAPAPAAPPAAAPAPAGAAAPSAPADYSVQAGDTLSEIARGLAGTEGYSLNQTMLALLRTNPEAFIGEDINRLRAGAVLRMPSQDELARYSTAQATAMVREQVANWRRARQAQAQPASASDAAGTEAAAGTGTGATAKRVADARLEIAPPQSSSSAQAGTQSGASAGGEGEMLRQELQQTKETLAARDAEVAELKARVAELEQLQKEQQRLIAMKDDALAGSQQRLAATNAAQQAPADASTAAQPESAGTSWWWLLPLALVLGGLAWWFRRRREAPGRSGARVSDRFATGAQASAATPAPGWAGKTKSPPAAPAPAAAVTPPPAASPTWAAPGAADAAVPSATPGERIALARASIDRGDRDTARTLLQEVIDGDDPQAREEARRVLQVLG